MSVDEDELVLVYFLSEHNAPKEVWTALGNLGKLFKKGLTKQIFSQEKPKQLFLLVDGDK